MDCSQGEKQLGDSKRIFIRLEHELEKARRIEQSEQPLNPGPPGQSSLIITMVKAWYMDDRDQDDQRLPHKTDPLQEVSLDELKKLGVEYWRFDPSDKTDSQAYEELIIGRGYNYQDLCEVSPSTLSDYEAKIKSFYEEHIHTDEEIRHVLDGSGYFDVRDTDDRWIRIEVVRGDMIVLPAGIYHRFTLDTSNYIKAMRLFIGEPVWTPYMRSQLEENDPSVVKYRQMVTAQT